MRLADEAYPCGPAPAAQSYLDQARSIEIARACGARGDPSRLRIPVRERAPSRARCRDAGLVFVGPKPATIEAMGDKVTSRRLMQKAGVPIVPGSTAKLGDDEACAFALEIGLPGDGEGHGGRRRQRHAPGAHGGGAPARDRARALGGALELSATTRSTSRSSSSEPRHIEIQILGDAHGNVIHLFERECSVQRRHQKVIEEAPANRMTPVLRESMGQAAVAAARAVGYEGAGTIEFLVDENQSVLLPGDEHARAGRAPGHRGDHQHRHREDAASASPRASRSASRRARSASTAGRIECRIYAEDPDKGFLPSPGEIVALPPAGRPRRARRLGRRARATWSRSTTTR